MNKNQEQTGPVDATRAQELTEQLRTAIEDVRAAVLVLARRVRAAHRARVWTVLEYPSWSAYALAEFGVGRSTAYRLLDLAAVAEAIENTVQSELGVSHAWDSTDLVLPVRAVVDLKGRPAAATRSPATSGRWTAGRTAGQRGRLIVLRPSRRASNGGRFMKPSQVSARR
ncbi:hypothetical protein ACH4E7_45085 [Kitasatospora sp. NPDC018058]|uniref:hypothetical protein n=1 Tax=Kitasatospora sp. NPDC018058 TaxID=3364025 RepID=UPI0037BF365E